MFWILRRSRFTNAAALLNNLNNNHSGNQTKLSNDNRPARKNYDKLSTDEQVITTLDGCLDNEVKRECNNEHDANFTDIEIDNGDDYTDDESEYDEALTCNVCDRTFACFKQLSSHKQKKRHFGCSACDSLFPSLMALEHHKEEFEHWSGDEDLCTDSEDDDDDDAILGEECERLL